MRLMTVMLMTSMRVQRWRRSAMAVAWDEGGWNWDVRSGTSCRRQEKGSWLELTHRRLNRQRVLRKRSCVARGLFELSMDSADLKQEDLVKKMDQLDTTSASQIKKKKSKSSGIKEEAMFAWDKTDNSRNDLEGLRLIDIGANLADACFNDDRETVLHRAAEKGKIYAVIVTGTSINQSDRALKIAENITVNKIRTLPRMYATAGVHPHDVNSLEPTTDIDDHDGHRKKTVDKLIKLLSHPRCVAVGECGLDFNRDFSPRDVQKKWFEEQVRLAAEYGKPIFVHCREAVPELCDILEKVAKDFKRASDYDEEVSLPVPVVVHCFTGNTEEAKRILKLGCHIGFTGWICDEREGRSEAMAEVIEMVPDDKIMIETDAPYLPPRSITPSKLRPRRNEPCLLAYVLQKVAMIRGQSLLDVAEYTTENALRFFNIHDDENVD